MRLYVCPSFFLSFILSFNPPTALTTTATRTRTRTRTSLAVAADGREVPRVGALAAAGQVLLVVVLRGPPLRRAGDLRGHPLLVAELLLDGFS
jgi:hypothetical protein